MLTFDNHINYLCKKLSCCIGTLKRMRHFMQEELKLTLYQTLFESHLVYGISVWGGISNVKLEKLFIVQKRCIRMLFGDYSKFLEKFMTCARVRTLGCQKLDASFFEKEYTKPLFTNYKILTVYNLYVYHCTAEIYKILKLRTPIGIYSQVTVSKRKPTLLLTESPTIYFFYKSSKFWNYLCKDIIGDSLDFSVSIGAVKHTLKHILIHKQTMYHQKLWGKLNYVHE